MLKQRSQMPLQQQQQRGGGGSQGGEGGGGSQGAGGGQAGGGHGGQGHEKCRKIEGIWGVHGGAPPTTVKVGPRETCLPRRDPHLDPRFLSHVAACDVASIIRQDCKCVMSGDLTTSSHRMLMSSVLTMGSNRLLMDTRDKLSLVCLTECL